MNVPKKLEKRIASLINAEHSLRKMVHNSGCKDVFICPKEHGCGENLSLETSIYWELADTIKEFRIYYKYQDEVKDMKEQLYVIGNILERHQEEKRVYKALRICDRVEKVMDELEDYRSFEKEEDDE